MSLYAKLTGIRPDSTTFTQASEPTCETLAEKVATNPQAARIEALECGSLFFNQTFLRTSAHVFA